MGRRKGTQHKDTALDCIRRFLAHHRYGLHSALFGALVVLRTNQKIGGLDAVGRGLVRASESFDRQQGVSCFHLLRLKHQAPPQSIHIHESMISQQHLCV
jgi:hypothetical protein